MTHHELCEKTAKWALNKNDVILFDYNSFSTGEFPDCLAFDGFFSTLYEIKVERSDFLVDMKKECRKSHILIREKVYYWESKIQDETPYWAEKQLVARYKEKPHMGKKRYYVCPSGLIDSSEVGCWGLVWVKNDRFYIKKESVKFRNPCMKKMLFWFMPYEKKEMLVI